MKISEMITDRYKLRIPPTVYYDLLADVQEVEEEQEPTTKNDLSSELEKNSKKLEKDFGELDYISREDALDCVNIGISFCDVYKKINDLPSVTPQEPQTFRWCTDCREYDQEKHCCHRWSKVIRNTVEDLKQEYIEREVLDDLRAEVETEKLEDSPNFCVKAHNSAVDRVLGIIDKYKAENNS